MQILNTFITDSNKPPSYISSLWATGLESRTDYPTKSSNFFMPSDIKNLAAIHQQPKPFREGSDSIKENQSNELHFQEKKKRHKSKEVNNCFLYDCSFVSNCYNHDESTSSESTDFMKCNECSPQESCSCECCSGVDVSKCCCSFVTEFFNS